MSLSSLVTPLPITYKRAVQYQSLDPTETEADLARAESERSAYNSLRYIKIFHPGYPDASVAPLFAFPPLDHGGVDYDLAIHACYLLVDNAWPRDGESYEETPYLSYSDNPKEQSPEHVIKPSAIVITRNCYLHVPKHVGPEPYPITPTFFDWRFPHDLNAVTRPADQGPTVDLPAAWREATIPNDPNHMSGLGRLGATLSRDLRCRVTNWSTGIEAAYLCPKEAIPWFNRNCMDRYTYDSGVMPQVHDISNQLLLRADVHIMLDRKDIVMIPKKVDGRYVFVIKVIKAFSDSLFDAYRTFHNRICQDLVGVRIEYLFARFAWNILNPDIIHIFSSRNLSLRVRIFRPGSLSTQGYFVEENLASQYRARSQSASGESDDDDDVCFLEGEGTVEDSWSSSDEDQQYEERVRSLETYIRQKRGLQERGRKRTR
ncbi:hypothetical protein F4818DRAFT_46104 [Hypoxylon cercidicola]|nr:hypothetical protein F4818DRAFT_46104 [Hypoxylon cercidicola]